METEIINKVSSSELISIDLESSYPENERVIFDIKPLLFQELMLREKDFREYVKTHDWSIYFNKYIAITCSTDAIVPTWAYMLIMIKIQPFAKIAVFGDADFLEKCIWQSILQSMDLRIYTDAKVVIKGCSKKQVPVFAYTELTRLLRPLASSIMFGEPCSTVPLFKKQKN
ncbi:MAG: DUF2480 family protein [Cytophagales bacterium]|nr:MAG: DUF2480 family protein [Cytophagales bacterium]